MSTKKKTRGLISIIIPVWNQLEFTRQCIRALKTHTRIPWELIVIDNGSTDHSAAYLTGLQDGTAVPVTVIANTKNRGFPAAINQGLRAARGDYLVMLNNDVVVTDNWLEQLIALAEMRNHVSAKGAEDHATPLDRVVPHEPGCHSSLPTADCRLPTAAAIGLVGPMSNYAAPPQLVESVPYRDLKAMHDFARRWREEHRGKWFTAHKPSGFCLLMKRAVYEAIGGLDERFGLGFFDDDDLGERARRAGFELAVARDLFVHHFGSRTFQGNRVDAEKLLDENARRFADKWGLEKVNSKQVELRPWPRFLADSQREFALQVDEPGCPDTALPHRNGVAPAARSVKVSLALIVRDEEDNLARCLESVRGLFYEIIVVDTGSVDRTKEVARSFGARVFDFGWVDDFAAARNEALTHATGDYVFWLDADDVLEPGERGKLGALLSNLRLGDDAGYVVRCACSPSPDGVKTETVVDHVRLFPLRPGVRWTYRVHEQILPSLKRVKVPVRWTDLVVRHNGYADQAIEARKLERNVRILRRELEERPDDPFVLFNLGASAVQQREWPEALGFLERSLAGSAPADSIVRKLYALIARAHQMMGDTPAALRTCAEGLKLDANDAELWFRKAVIHRHRREPAEAERCWRRILELKRPDQFCSFDQGIFGHLTRRNLAALAAERGDRAEAKRLWEAVLAECPGDRDAQASLGRAPAAAPVAPRARRADEPGPWIVPESRRAIVPSLGPDDFDPYAPLAERWIRALGARVVVALGVRFGGCTRALLAGARAVDGQVWGVDLLERHDVADERFTFIQADPIMVAARWERIDLLHVDIDPQCEGDARRWLAEYANRCRAIAFEHSHHPGFRLGPVIAELAATNQWQVFEYRGNLAGWTVFLRSGETCPDVVCEAVAG